MVILQNIIRLRHVIGTVLALIRLELVIRERLRSVLTIKSKEGLKRTRYIKRGLRPANLEYKHGTS